MYYRDKKAEEAVDKRQQAEHTRNLANSYRRRGDTYRHLAFTLDADKLEREAGELDKADGHETIGAGGEVVSLPAGQSPGRLQVRETLIEDQMTFTASSASNQRLNLLKRLDITAPALEVAISIKAENSLEKMLAHQIAACHHLGMKLCAEAQQYKNVNLQNKTLAMGIRFMDTFQKELETLTRLRTGGQQQIVVKHQQVNVSDGGQAVIADKVNRGGGGRDER